MYFPRNILYITLKKGNVKMVNPIYGDPSYRILESVGPNTIGIKVEILDFRRFVERILSIKDGGTWTLEKRAPDVGVRIILSNIDSGSVKAL